MLSLSFHRECQRRTWLSHKVICGKPLTLNGVEESFAQSLAIFPTETERRKPHLRLDKVGPPVEPFRRSSALNVHIYRLSESQSEGADFIVHYNSGEYIIFTFPLTPPTLRTVCVDARELAMTKGDRPAIAALCQFVLWHLMGKEEKSKCMTHLQANAALHRWAVEFDYPGLKDEVENLFYRQIVDCSGRP